MKERLPSLTIAIPAYNEQECLPYVLRRTIGSAKKYLDDFEILIIDDGSTDRTGALADAFAKRYRSVRVIHQKNGGYGNAMLRGIGGAKKDFVAFMPADGQFFIEDMKHCLPLMKSADLILGYRGSRADYTFYRLILSYAYLVVLRVLFRITYKDVNWLNIWRTSKVRQMPVDSRGIFMLAELVIRFKRRGLTVVEAASFYRPRLGGKAKNAKPSVAWRTFSDALRLWWKLTHNTID